MEYKEIQKKAYYRLLKVLFWALLIFAFVGSLITRKDNQPLQAINLIALNALVMLIIWKVILYIKYGKIEYSQNQKINNGWIWGMLILISLTTFLIFLLA